MQGPFPLTADDKPAMSLRQQANAPLEMYVHSDVDIYVSKTIAETGQWEPYETQLLKQLLNEGSVFLDVGANIGYYTVLASRWLGDTGRVFSFEPESSNFALLQKNIAHNRLVNVTAVHAGLSNIESADVGATDKAVGEKKHAGTERSENNASLYLNLENRGDHQIFPSASDDVPRQVQPIRLLNGSDYLGSRIDRIDVLKVDTQGAEMMVLQGLEPLVRQSLPKLSAIIEFSPYSLKQSGASGIELLDLIAGWQLPMHLIDHIGHALIPISYQQMCDWIFQTDSDTGNQGFVNLLLAEV